MIIHEYIPKRKAKKPNAKTKQLKSDWEKLLKKYEIQTKKTVVSSKRVTHSSSIRVRTGNNPVSSVDTGVGLAPKLAPKVYTGDAMIGIAQMHKSNAVPVFKQEDAIDISRMRR